MVNKDDIWQQYLNGKIDIDDKVSKYDEFEKKAQNYKMEIDLHYLNADQAFRKLEKALSYAKQNSIKEIEIITGTNTKNNIKTGKLYQEVPRWLEHSTLSSQIVSIHYKENNDAVIIIKLKTEITKF
jgi:DNA-nicking Smr family endonuclease